MKLANVIVVGLVVMLGILGLMLACYVVADGVDPCPQLTTKSSTPCPWDENNTIYDDCDRANCSQTYTAYSAVTLNTGYQNNPGVETYTTAISYVDGGYVAGSDGQSPTLACSTYTICKLVDETQKCEAYSSGEGYVGKIYSVHACDGSY